MADNTNIRGPVDSTRINVNESYEIQWWTKRFGISEQDLRKAVAEKGVMVAEVERYLKK